MSSNEQKIGQAAKSTVAKAVQSEDNNGEVLKKHVNSVAMVPTTRKISLVGRRCYNILLHIAQETGEQETYKAPLHLIAKLSESDNSNYELFKKTLRQLVSTVVEWQSPTAGEFETWDACGMLAGVTLTKNVKSGAITMEWSFAPNIRSQLLSPNRYARISLDVVTQMRSHASLALYEICARYIDNPRHLTARQPWRWWKPVLTGQPENPKQKSEYRYFKRDVLTNAIAEINAISDIIVTGPIEFKGQDNKTIEDIQFEVHPKYKSPILKVKTRPEPIDINIINDCIKAGIKQEDAERLYDDYGPKRLAEAIIMLADRSNLPTDKFIAVQSPIRWIRAILQSMNVSPKAEGEHKIIEEGTKPVPMNRQAKWTDEWLRRRRESLKNEFQSIDNESQAGWLSRFRQHLSTNKTILIKRYDQSGWQHPMIVGDFIKFYASKTQGDGWDKPSPEALLQLASEIGDS